MDKNVPCPELVQSNKLNKENRLQILGGLNLQLFSKFAKGLENYLSEVMSA